MRLTEAQKQRISLYRKHNMGYGEIAKIMGLAKSTVSVYCQRNQLAGDRSRNAISSKSETCMQASSVEQQSTEPKECPAETKNRRSKKEIHPTVTVVYAKEPDLQAVEDVKNILLHARRRTDTDYTWKKKK